MVLWVLAAVAGFLMFGEWIAQGGNRRPSTSHLPEPLVLGHFLCAATGVVVWVLYMFAHTTSLAWTGFGFACVISFLGLRLFVRWLPVRAAEEELPEKYFPYPVVGAHGLFAAAILLLTLLTALGLGG